MTVRIHAKNFCLAMLAAAPLSLSAQVTMMFDLPAQPLAESLKALGTQTNTNVLVAPELVDGKEAPALRASLTVDQAMAELLKGTGVTYRFLSDKTVILAAEKKRDETISAIDSDPEGARVRMAQAEGSSAADGSTGSGEGSEQKQNAAGAEESQEGAKLEEIVVTAQKRVERLTDVPISISVLSGRELDKFTNGGVSEALTLVPGMRITQEGYLANGNTQLSMRGVAASGATFAGSSPVAYYVDSVPFGLVKSAIVPDSNPYDLDRIEVLRGPQGTLYGANALNGVVRVLTHDADLDKFELKTRASLSSTQEGGESYRGDLAINMPIAPGKLAARAVLGYNDMSGWIDHPNKKDANDTQIRNARLKVNAQPTDKLSWGLSAWLSRSDFGAPSHSDDQDRYPGALDTPMSTDYDALGFNLGYQFAEFSVSSTTSYVDYANYGRLDLSTLGVNETYFTGFDSEVFAQEITLNSTHGGSWRWSAGAFYRDGEDRLLQKEGGLQFPVDFTDTSESMAIFGELTRRFLNGKLELTGGLRYFEDDVAQIENSPFDGDTTRSLIRASGKFDAISPRLVLTWHPIDETTFYGSYSEGFRSGFNQNANVKVFAPDYPPVKEDTLRNYELGSKGSLLGGLVSYEAALYYIDWQDVQQTILLENPPGSGFVWIAGINGESASGMGFDYAMTVRPVKGLNLGMSFNWSDLALNKAIFQGNIQLFDKGERLNYSGEYTAGASADYTFPFGAKGLEGQLSISANYSSKLSSRRMIASTLFIDDGDNILNSQVSFAISSPERWSASLFVDNANNERNSPMRTLQSFGIDFLTARIRPRTIGVQFAYHY